MTCDWQMCARLQYNLVLCECLVAPDAIYNHVKTYREEVKNVHYAAPEYAGQSRTNSGVFRRVSGSMGSSKKIKKLKIKLKFDN